VDGATLCPEEISPGSNVELSTEYGLRRGQARAAAIPNYKRTDVATIPGDSGGGVFDRERGCLAGIVSSGGQERTNYVPARILRAMLDQLSSNELARRKG